MEDKTSGVCCRREAGARESLAASGASRAPLRRKMEHQVMSAPGSSPSAALLLLLLLLPLLCCLHCLVTSRRPPGTSLSATGGLQVRMHLVSA